ncbi:MAG: OmpA family protein [Deltaproteobacteria bacterium]|nr:OmpA family protein [Deltaproteobacteria bacterium]
MKIIKGACGAVPKGWAANADFGMAIMRHKHDKRLGTLALWCLFAGLMPGAAAAQTLPTFDLEQLVLEPAASRLLVVGGGKILAPGAFRLALAGQYQKDPLVLYRGDDKVGSLVGNRTSAHVLGAVALGDRLELGFSLPYIASQDGDDLAALGIAKAAQNGLASPSVALRLALMSERLSDAFDLAVGVAVGLPLGNKRLLARDDKTNVRATVGVGKNLGLFELGVDVSLWLRPSQTFAIGTDAASGRQLTFAAGVATTGNVRLELAGRGLVGLKEQGKSLELLAGIRVPAGQHVELFALGGPGFGQPVGSPAFRVLAGLAFKPAEPAAVVPDEPPPPVLVDPCVSPTAPVDRCPNNDADGDAIINRLDKCPLVPEDKDAFEDDDGCVDPDNDKDAVLDGDDKCPLVPGDKAFAGCPPPDEDHDGVLDPDDQCPQEAGPKERLGCPAKDKDGDTVMDDVDNCIDEPGPAENQGCPKQNRQLVRITKDKLVILDMVYFNTGKATIKKRSFLLLSQIASVLLEHPEVRKVRVEGHTDSQGNDEKNMRLSQARAESVRAFLVKAGVSEARLSAQGYGESRPIETNATSKGRAANRRVEFVIESNEEP